METEEDKNAPSGNTPPRTTRTIAEPEPEPAGTARPEPAAPPAPAPARRDPVSFSFGTAAALCGVLWFAVVPAEFVVGGYFWMLAFFAALAAGFFLRPSDDRKSRWCFVVAIVAFLRDFDFVAVVPLLAASLALASVSPALGRSGFRRTGAVGRAAFGLCLAAWIPAFFLLPGEGKHAGTFRAALFVLTAGWAAVPAVLRSRPLPEKIPADAPRIALLAGLAATLAGSAFLFFSQGLRTAPFLLALSFGLLLAALVASALDGAESPDAGVRSSGTAIRRFGPAAVAAFHAVVFLFFFWVLPRHAFHYVVQWAVFVLLAAFLAIRCGWLDEEALRRRLAAAAAAMRALPARIRERLQDEGPETPVAAAAAADPAPESTAESSAKPAPSGGTSGSMPASWWVMQIVGWLVLAASVVGGVVALTDDDLRSFGAGRPFATVCGTTAVLTSLWFLFLACCRKFERGVETLEAGIPGVVRTPMGPSWVFLLVVGALAGAVYAIGTVASFVAWRKEEIDAVVPLSFLLALVFLAPHFLFLFLARRFHDGVCALETAAGKSRPEPGPMPFSWYVCRVALAVLLVAFLVCGSVLVVRGVKDTRWYRTGEIMAGLGYWFALVPVASGFLGLFLVRRFWSAVGCLRVLSFLPAGDSSGTVPAVGENVAEPPPSGGDGGDGVPPEGVVDSGPS